MKIYGSENTNLVLTERAEKTYSNSDPLRIVEREVESDDYRYDVSGILSGEDLTADEVIRMLEDLADDLDALSDDPDEVCGGETVSYYDYANLREKAVSADATQSDIDALGEWFQSYGQQFWNGEVYDADGFVLRPVQVYDEDSDTWETTGYEIV